MREGNASLLRIGGSVIVRTPIEERVVRWACTVSYVQLDSAKNRGIHFLEKENNPASILAVTESR